MTGRMLGGFSRRMQLSRKNILQIPGAGLNKLPGTARSTAALSQ